MNYTTQINGQQFSLHHKGLTRIYFCQSSRLSVTSANMYVILIAFQQFYTENENLFIKNEMNGSVHDT